MVLDAATEARIYQKLLPILGDEDTAAFLAATQELSLAHTLSPAPATSRMAVTQPE
jgi:hypothetical protein